MPNAGVTFVSIPQEILFATDFCEAASRALLVGRQLALLRRTAVRAVHVVDLTGYSDGKRPSAHAARESAERMLRETRRELRHAGVPEAATLITGGRPAAAIREAAVQFRAELLVLGLNGGRSGRSDVVGSTTRALLRSAPCPVVTVHAECPAAVADIPKRVHVVREAPDQRWDLPLERILPPGCRPQISITTLVNANAEYRLSPDSTAESVLAVEDRAGAEKLLREWTSVRPDFVILCVGTHGALDSLARGSLACSIIIGAPCPVVTIRG